MEITQEQFDELISRMDALESFVAEKRVQQIKFPLDQASQNIIKNI